MGVPQAAVFRTQRGLLVGALHHQFHFFQIERLGDVVVRAQAHGFHGVADGAVSGDADDLHIRLHGPQFLHQVDAPRVGQANVHHGHVEIRLVGFLQGVLRRMSRLHAADFALQLALEQPGDGRFVVHHQHAVGVRHGCPPSARAGAR